MPGSAVKSSEKVKSKPYGTLDTFPLLDRTANLAEKSPTEFRISPSEFWDGAYFAAFRDAAGCYGS
jgi:hypothetical protein